VLPMINSEGETAEGTPTLGKKAEEEGERKKVTDQRFIKMDKSDRGRWFRVSNAASLHAGMLEKGGEHSRNQSHGREKVD